VKGTVVPEGALKRPLPLDPEDQVGGALVLFRRGRRPLAVVRDGGTPVHPSGAPGGGVSSSLQMPMNVCKRVVVKTS
jgi:hypothetical protein